MRERAAGRRLGSTERERPKAQVDTGFLPSSTVTFREYGGPPLCRRAVQQRQRRVDGGVARERFPAEFAWLKSALALILGAPGA
jgi:hypothetical protein